MPRPDPAAIRAGAEALGCPLTAKQLEQLTRYLSLLAQWNQVVNLTAIRDEGRMATLHLLDCLALVPAIDRHAGGRAPRLLDVGSGGGLPGAVLAMARPAWQVSCVDSVAKKVRFVQQVALELSLTNLQAAHGRIERMPSQPADVVISRAFASLSDFTAWTRKHLGEHGVWLAMKGRVPSDELSSLPADVEVFHVEQLDVPGLDAERCAIWMRPRP